MKVPRCSRCGAIRSDGDHLCRHCREWLSSPKVKDPTVERLREERISRLPASVLWVRKLSPGERMKQYRSDYTYACRPVILSQGNPDLIIRLPFDEE